jgi:DNA-binding transcriptional MerR regulator
MAKSADAFRTISEVSTELDVPKHVLRFWEQRFKQLKPLKRGGGRRFYRPEDVELIKGIQTLLNRDAYTIRGVQRILKEQGVEIVKRLATGDAAALLAATPPVGEASPSPASKGGRKTGSRKPARIRVEALHADRGVVEAAISELSACRALLAGETLRTKAPLVASAASSRR